MKKNEYNRLIKRIEPSCSACCDNDDSLWMELEGCYNSFVKNNFYHIGTKNIRSVNLDDDKHHFNHSKEFRYPWIKEVLSHQRK